MSEQYDTAGTLRENATKLDRCGWCSSAKLEREAAAELARLRRELAEIRAAIFPIETYATRGITDLAGFLTELREVQAAESVAKAEAIAAMKARAERAEAELSENGKPAMTDRESRCIVCDGRLAKDNFCGKCGVRTRPAASMSPRERRLVEKVKDLLANSTEEDDVEADEYGAMIRGKWREVRSALAAYDAPTP